VLSLVKAGEGIQTFSGTGYHSGTTTVENGTLIINGDFSAASGAVTLQAGTTLGGRGVIGGALTATGIVSPGDGAGTLSVANHVTWNGSVSNPWRWDLATEDGSDLLFVFGDFLKGSGSTYLFDLAGTGEPGTYVVVEWGGATTFAASAFSATNLPAGLEAAFSIVGKQLLLTLTEDGEPPATGYAAWAAEVFPPGTPEADQLPEADPDGDGTGNLLEYAFATDPVVPGALPPAEIAEDDGNRYLQIRWTRPANRNDIATSGEVSRDLTGNVWSADPAEVSTTITVPGPGMETVTIRMLEPLGSSALGFLRARVVLTASPP
jgi:autotransporter-associated beta strand protein